jgi:hypothetical protein
MRLFAGDSSVVDVSLTERSVLNADNTFIETAADRYA